MEGLLPRDLDRSDALWDLVGHLYDAAEKDAWESVAARIGGAFGASAGLLRIADGQSSFIARSPDIDDGWAREYRAHYDRLTQVSGAGHSGRPRPRPDAAAQQPLIGPADFRCEHRHRSQFHGIGSVIAVHQRESAVFGIHRPASAPPYDDSEKTRIKLLLPHLQRALRLRQRFGAGQNPGPPPGGRHSGAVAAIVVEQDCRVRSLNEAAAALLRAGDAVRLVGGRLAGADEAATERLREIIAAALDPAALGEAAIVHLSRTEDMPLAASIAALRPAEPAKLCQPCVVLLIGAPAAGTVAAAPLQSAFGLTAAEAAIASALAAGKSISQIAARQSISPHTARVHVKSIFGKTGTKRQAELVSLLLGGGYLAAAQ